MIAAPGMRSRVQAVPGIRPSAGRVRVSSRSRAARIWFGALLVAICFEGLGRKFLPFVPAIAFYFAKDGVLLAGLGLFGISRGQLALVRSLLGPFRLVMVCAVAWTLVQMFNPSQPSLPLALIGLRAYWLWWLAPPVVASALRDEADRAVALKTLAIVSVAVSLLAVAQFAAPSSAQINTYAWQGSEVGESIASVPTTGRARVTSTFSYITGFTDFVIIAPALLLALGLAESARRSQWLSLAAAGLLLAVTPMSGSRGPVLVGGVAVVLVGWRAGLLRSRAGRRVMAVVGLALAGSLLLAPDAMEGVMDRFGGSDTQERFRGTAEYLPPVAVAINAYPLLGIGTGTEQNARVQFGVRSEWDTENEAGRLLVELGVAGYVLIWLAKVGLAVGLARAARVLKLRGQAAMSGGALAFACFAFIGNHEFDHIWQALFFVGVGLVFRMLEVSCRPAGVRADSGIVAEPGPGSRVRALGASAHGKPRDNAA